MNPKIDAFLGRATVWQKEMKKLRSIALDCGLTEELKWGKPCYTFDGKNIVVIQGFKDYSALLFIKGYLLKDPDGILVKTGENTIVGRQARYTDVKQIVKQEAALKACIFQAIEVEKAGIKPPAKKVTKPDIPEELQKKLDKTPALKKAFAALTPGRQKAYSFYIAQAKQSKTREARIEKCTPQILKGKGLMD